jgi:lipoate-protein ligase A
MWMDNWVLNLPLPLWPPEPRGAPTTHRILYRCFESKRNVVVLANSNQAEREAQQLHCAENDVPILKRKGGGGTVLLGPGCLILTFAFYAKDLFSNHLYFEIINDLWIRALKSGGIEGVKQRGISDLAMGDKKIAGTSLFRKKHLLVYQGSLLVHPNLEAISHLLAHPSKEPDYRQGRSHLDFLTTLREQGYTGSASDLAQICQVFFEKEAHAALHEHFATPEILAQGGIDFWEQARKNV